MEEIHIYFAFTICGVRERCSFGQITGQRGGIPERAREVSKVLGLKTPQPKPPDRFPSSWGTVNNEAHDPACKEHAQTEEVTIHMYRGGELGDAPPGVEMLYSCGQLEILLPASGSFAVGGQRCCVG